MCWANVMQRNAACGAGTKDKFTFN